MGRHADVDPASFLNLRGDPPRVGRIDVSVAVMQPGAAEPVLDARARLGAQPRWHGGLRDPRRVSAWRRREGMVEPGH